MALKNKWCIVTPVLEIYYHCKCVLSDSLLVPAYFDIQLHQLSSLLGHSQITPHPNMTCSKGVLHARSESEVFTEGIPELCPEHCLDIPPSQLIQTQSGTVHERKCPVSVDHNAVVSEDTNNVADGPEKETAQTTLSENSNVKENNLQAPGCSAQIVKIQGTSSEPIQVFEVEVLSNNKNVAVGKSASQSSTYQSRTPASNAVDGSNSTLSHTSSEPEPWWQVDLQQIEVIQIIQIVNRFCGDRTDTHKCLCRLSDAKLELYDETGSTLLASRALGDTCGEHTVVEAFESCSSTTTASQIPAGDAFQSTPEVSVFDDKISSYYRVVQFCFMLALTICYKVGRFRRLFYAE